MLPDRVSNPGPLTYESGALPIALLGPANLNGYLHEISIQFDSWLSRYILGTVTYSLNVMKIR